MIQKIINLFKPTSSKENDSKNLNENHSTEKNRPFCMAPWSSMSFNIDGTVAVCCYNKKTTISIVGKTIKEVWASSSFEALRNHVNENDLSYDCQICLEKVQSGSTTNLKARDYDKFNKSDWPQIMEFCLENTCNLACEMCNSILSSTIRKNNNLPPSLSKYNQEFLTELNEFIPHLKEAVFVGGEPFLIPSYFEIWDKMRELNPSIEISVVTNGSVLNDRIKNILENGRFNLNISIDSMDKEVYEKIRNNAKFETLIKNFEWFSAYCKKKKTSLNIPICPMTTNWETIPDLVRFANKQEAYINFCYVDKPLSLSLIECSPEFLTTILNKFETESFEKESYASKQNVEKFENLIQDIQKWREKNSNKKPTVLLSFNDLKTHFFKKIQENEQEKFKIILSMIEELINAESEKNQTYLIKIIDELSPDRIYQICNNKTIQELTVIINDLLGSSRKRKQKK